MSKVGLIGVGAIGKGVLKNLIKHNCEVVAFDISEQGIESIKELGGIVADHPKDVAKQANIIILSLPGPKIVKDLFLGDEGILHDLNDQTCIIDLSTIDPTTTQELARVCKDINTYYFDCPVSGGPLGADEGTLTIMVGGDEEKYEYISEYLNYIGSNIRYIGTSGLAQTLKLCHNMVVAANTVALGEAFATGVKHGLDIEVMADVIGKSIGNSRTLQYFGPNIVNDTYDNIKFMLNHMHKDMGLYVNMAQQIGVPSMIGTNTYQLYQAAKVQNKGHLDHTAVCQVIEELSSTKLVNKK
ncbi:NAD(P)-dependent oxidoreductase [bacterium LRH843]|nr:NAD(P)-dependent oxidoreductase [bacterium LRH843]